MKFEEPGAQLGRKVSDISVAAVYFLLDDDEVVYVGKSVNLHMRLADHFRYPGFAFNGFAFVVCDRDILGYEEAKYIGKYRPKHNVRERNALR